MTFLLKSAHTLLNFVYTKQDLTIPGRYPITFTRTYNAMGSLDGILGQGWTHNYNIRMFILEDNYHITFEDGHVETFTLVDNMHLAPLDSTNTLIPAVQEDENNHNGYAYDLMLKDNTRYRFDMNGVLRCMAHCEHGVTA